MLKHKHKHKYKFRVNKNLIRSSEEYRRAKSQHIRARTRNYLASIGIL